MGDSTAQRSCSLCGGPLAEYDIKHQHGACHDCRSPKGKITDLDIAIRAFADDPKRINDWPVIRHLLRQRFGGEPFDEVASWKRCTDWLRAEGQWEPNDYLPLPLEALAWLLKNDFSPGYQEEIEQIVRRDLAARAENLRDNSARPTARKKKYKTSGEATASRRVVKSAQELPTPQQPGEASVSADGTSDLSLLDEFPATSAGHMGFLEWVRDEVHYAAEAKRAQFERGYSNTTIESMVRGIKWAEAGRRLSAVSDLPTVAVEQVARVLRRELTPGTVEPIDELLALAVRELRDAWENRDIPLLAAETVRSPTIVETGNAGQPAPDEYEKLREYSAANFRGGQRRMVERLIDAGGTMPIADLRAAADIQDANRMRSHVQVRLAKAGWRIERHDNQFRLIRSPRQK